MQIYKQSPPPQIVIYLTGGGAKLFPWMLATPGASKCVLEFKVPYSQKSLELLLNTRPRRFCGPDVARKMALAAYAQAQLLQSATDDSEKPPCIGLGCTAALRSERPRRGQHRCFIAVCTSQGLLEITLELAKNARSRELEDEVVARCALLGLAIACDIAIENEKDFWQLLPNERTEQQNGARAEQVALDIGEGEKGTRAAPFLSEEFRWQFSEHSEQI